jgi:hypothetical protein
VLAGVGGWAAFEAAANKDAADAALNTILAGVFSALSGVLGGLAGLFGWKPSDPNCNGAVLGRNFVYHPGELARKGSLSTEPTLETAKSPSECGNDPHATVTYGVHSAPFPLVGDGRLRPPGISVIHPRSDEGAVSLYVIGSDGKVWSNFWPAAPGSSAWNGWFPIGDNTFPQGSSVSIIHPRSDEGAVSLYVIGSDGKVWSNFWPAAPGSSAWNGWFPMSDMSSPH